MDHKDLSRVRPVQHGIKNESCAADRYLAVMHSMGHHASSRHCGLVNPSCPWLGASPDRLVFDPEEGSYGVVEIKCPYKLKDSDASTAAQETFRLMLEDGIPHLKRDDVYFFQVLGQMAFTGYHWTDFVVFTEKWVAEERIRFDEEEWVRVKERLDRFFFALALPYFTRQDR